MARAAREVARLDTFTRLRPHVLAEIWFYRKLQLVDQGGEHELLSVMGRGIN